MPRTSLVAPVLLALALAACAGGARSTGPTLAAGGSPRGKAEARRAAPLTFEPCQASACMVHPRTGAYHQCLHAAGGVCFTNGAPCTPTDTCVFDPSARAYRACARPLVGAGTCAAFGAACTPTARCVLDPASGKHRACERPSPGGCARYGAPCGPT
jgi:hypothetical protein